MGIIFRNFKKNLIDDFIGSLSSTPIYVTAGNPIAWPDDNNPPGVFETYNEGQLNSVNKLIFGKRIGPANVGYLVQKNVWIGGTTYDRYDPTDIALFSKSFFVINSTNDVFKCLNNNAASPSMVMPSLVQPSSFTTSDGYQWKYMFSVSSGDLTKFATNAFIPVTPNSTIQTTATTGIETAILVSGGNGYITSTTGIIQSLSSTNNQILQIGVGSINNNFYNGSSIYITNGGAAGQLQPITAYVVNSSGNWITTNQPLTSIIPSQTQYEINPSVTINGDGSGARAISRCSNGYVSSVIMLSPGLNYSHATASVTANSTFGSGATVSVVVAPPGGHGANPITELGCQSMGITVNFANTEANTIPAIAGLKYRTIGLYKAPQIANSNIALTSNTFQQILTCNVSPSTTFSQGNIIVGSSSQARGYVAFANSSSLSLIGDKSFQISENIVEYFANNVPTGKSAAINIVTSYGDVDQTSGEMLYLNNVKPIQRTATSTETIKLAIQV